MSLGDSNNGSNNVSTGLNRGNGYSRFRAALTEYVERYNGCVQVPLRRQSLPFARVFQPCINPRLANPGIYSSGAVFEAHPSIQL